jgi:hypothetical protein
MPVPPPVVAQKSRTRAGIQSGPRNSACRTIRSKSSQTNVVPSVRA